MKPEDCPKYERCNANICPLDVDWRIRVHLQSEPVCFYLREYSKVGGPERLAGRLPEDMARLVKETYEGIHLAGGGPVRGAGEIRRTLADSAKTGSRLEQGDRLKASLSQ